MPGAGVGRDAHPRDPTLGPENQGAAARDRSASLSTGTPAGPIPPAGNRPWPFPPLRNRDLLAVRGEPCSGSGGIDLGSGVDERNSLLAPRSLSAIRRL